MLNGGEARKKKKEKEKKYSIFACKWNSCENVENRIKGSFMLQSHPSSFYVLFFQQTSNRAETGCFWTLSEEMSLELQLASKYIAK